MKKAGSGKLKSIPLNASLDVEPTITVRGTVEFWFPAGTALNVQQRVIRQAVNKWQAEVREQERLEAQLANVREALRAAGADRRLSYSISEAAAELGISQKALNKARAENRITSHLCGYEERITTEALERFRAEPDRLWFMQGEPRRRTA